MHFSFFFFSKLWLENLKQSTKYYVWVKDVAGNISEVASTKTGTVPKLTDANTTITKSPNDWTKQEVIATEKDKNWPTLLEYKLRTGIK